MAIRIVTDSSADLPPQLAERWNITVVPCNVVVGDVSYKDGEPQVKLNMYRQKKKEPKTRDYQCDCKNIKYKGERR